MGSGFVLANGGPASAVIAYTVLGIMIYSTVQALGEMAVTFPIAGSFTQYSTRFIDPAWGFAMGWNYALSWLTILPVEIVATSIIIDYWNPPLSNAVWVAISWAMIVSINLFGVRGFAEAEFTFSLIKIIAVLGFM